MCSKGVVQHDFVLSLLLLILVFSPSGFAFVYFDEERDAEDAIRGLDNIPFGYDRRRLSVEWAKVCCLLKVSTLLCSLLSFPGFNMN